MKKYIKVTAALAALCAVLVGIATTTSPVLAFDLPFGLGTETHFGFGSTDETETEAVITETAESSFTECDISASRNFVATGDEVTLNWHTTGFSDLKINDEPISGDAGSKTFKNIHEDTTYFLSGTNSHGSKCEAKVRVGCKPPVETKVCQLEVDKAVDKATALPGDELTYTITVKNIGEADCTGGGVKIEDVVDPGLTYLSADLSSNLNAGYHNSPIYTATDKTLHFNGNTLNPGEVGTITLVTKVDSPSSCGDFEVTNQAKATAKELNNFGDWAYSPSIVTTIDNDCNTAPKKATVVASKVVCTDEADLPNYGKLGGPDMTADTATAWVADHASCSLQAGFSFEWTDAQGADPGDIMVGEAGAPWHAFGPTATDGKTSVEINLDDLTNEKVWFREVLKDGYIPFSYGQNANTNVDDVSAEFYCNTDVINYDNYDYIKGMSDGHTYYCVAWNSPTEEPPVPTCDLFTATPGTITVGASSTLTWETSNAYQVFLNNGIGEVAVDGSISVSPLADIVYRLTLLGANDTSVNCEVPVLVSSNSVPACEYFTATPNSLPSGGGNVTLNWKAVGATNASITPAIGAVSASGTKAVNVTTSTTYTLTATDDDGDAVSCEAPVTVADPTPTLSCANNVNFTVSGNSITRGQTVTLNWSTTNVDSVAISGINATTLSGSKSVSPSADTTYVLTATVGDKSINCPVTVNVSSGGGGGGSSSPRCDLVISDNKIKSGEKITLTWDTSNATDVSLTDERGNIIFSTADVLANKKRDYYDGSITLQPTRDTKYTLLAGRGSREKECTVGVDIEDSIVVLQTRDQQPLVAGIALSQVPYTGFEAGPTLTIMFYVLLVAWSLYITYLLVMRKTASTGPSLNSAPTLGDVQAAETKSVSTPETNKEATAMAATAAPTAVRHGNEPANLPTGNQTMGYLNTAVDSNSVIVNPHQTTDAIVTSLENRAHGQKALLSSDAVRYFIGNTAGMVERNDALDEVITEAKKHYPLEDGWIVINEARMRNLCAVCQLNIAKDKEVSFIPATIPEGSGSLAEAIVTGNIVAAYDMIGNRPMFALADAASDLDSVYRNRKGGQEIVSDMLSTEASKLSDEQIKNMIKALTSALDGTYNDEVSAVKMAIMKAVKEVV